MTSHPPRASSGFSPTEMAAAREEGGADRALHLASRRTKVAASVLHGGQPAAAGPAQFRVCALLGTFGSHKRSASCSTGNPAGARQPSGENCELRSSPQWQAVGNDLNAPVVLPDWVDVEVVDKHIEGDGRTSFAAHPGGSTPENAERAAPRTSEGSKMVAVRIMDCAAPAPGRGQGQRQAESAEQYGDSKVSSGRVGRVVRMRAA